MVSRFSLPKSFALIGAVVFVVAVAAMSYFHMSLSRARMMCMAEENDSALAFALSNVLHDSFEPSLRSAQTMDPEAWRAHPDLAALRRAVREVMAEPVWRR